MKCVMDNEGAIMTNEKTVLNKAKENVKSAQEVHAFTRGGSSHGGADQASTPKKNYPRPAHTLTKNERLVWDTLTETSEPLKAYEILDKLKEKGVRAPMTVYRALDGLENKGVIHKLDGINAFVLCNHEAPHSVQAFLVCDSCSHVKEVALDAKIRADVLPVITANNFHMEMARLEVKGQCNECAQRHQIA